MEQVIPDEPPKTPGQEDGINPPTTDHDAESLRESHYALQSKASEMEETLLLCRQERDAALKLNASLRETIAELSSERDYFRSKLEELQFSSKVKEDELAKRIEQVSAQKDEITNQLEDSRKRVDELELKSRETSELVEKSLDQIRNAQKNLIKLIQGLNDESVGSDNGEPRESLWREIGELLKLAIEADTRVDMYKEAREKEKKELENSVVSLTEENRDINSLLRVALVEKETVEKHLNKLKGNSEQKRVPLLQLGWQRVGFGFMMGNGVNEQATAESSASGSRSDGSESEEDVGSLVC